MTAAIACGLEEDLDPVEFFDILKHLRLAAPAGMGFYPKTGLDPLDTCFSLPRATTGTGQRP